MGIQLLIGDEPFAHPTRADRNGIVAMGGELTPTRLIEAYQHGIFPWYSEDMPVLWHSPDPRMVLPVQQLRVNRSLKKALAKRPYEISMDNAFTRVIEACAQVPRPGQDGTWITRDMIRAYRALHEMGLAHSVEAWQDDELVGGFYGVCLGAIFFGESMFALRPNASKIAFVHGVRQFQAWGIRVIDCQVYTEHLDSFGGEEWPRKRFLNVLKICLCAQETRQGAWAFDQDLPGL